MITVMDSVREPMKNNLEKCLDPQLFHACAGGMVQMPPINSKVFYFPQGHAEHACGKVDFGNSRFPSVILCRVSGIRYMADTETDEVFAKVRLIPLRDNVLDIGDDGSPGIGVENPEKPSSFAKTLTQSDANNGGGFSVPRYCAETIFPRLDYSADPPVQNILVKDVHGEIWKFRHIYRGTPRRHLLTTGWSNFVNQKKLVAGDSIVFLRADNGDLCVGIRRAKKGIGCAPEYPSRWNPPPGSFGAQFGGYSSFSAEEGNNVMGRSSNRDLREREKAEAVRKASSLAASGQPLEVVYYPRASTPEFFVRASTVRASMQIRWCPGIRFKMPFETEDSSRISWFMGTISSAGIADPIQWPDSPWRYLKVQWDEPDLLHNVKRVNPWLVEVQSSMPSLNVPPFSPPPRKKLRPLQSPDFPLVGQLPVPFFSSTFLNPSSPMHCIPDNVSAGIQGARHAQFVPYSSELRLNELQSGLFPVGFQQLDHTVGFQQLNHTGPRRNPVGNFMHGITNNDNLSPWLEMGHPTQSLKANDDETKAPYILLFGKVIQTEEHLSKTSSGENSSSQGNLEKATKSSDGSGLSSALQQNVSSEISSEGGSPWNKDHQSTDRGLETGHCKVFIESEDVGTTLDLSSFGSYQELYKKLGEMFGKGNSGMLTNVLYLDAAGSVKHIGNEPFSDFLKTARRLTILTDTGSDNSK
ncbi:hypothetical protein UlMin_025902 [Ulmus minor]